MAKIIEFYEILEKSNFECNYIFTDWEPNRVIPVNDIKEIYFKEDFDGYCPTFNPLITNLDNIEKLQDKFTSIDLMIVVTSGQEYCIPYYIEDREEKEAIENINAAIKSFFYLIKGNYYEFNKQIIDRF